MSRWLRRIRGAMGMGLSWAAGWAFVGILIGVGIEYVGLPMGWFIEVFDAPLPALAIPGFVSGAAFSLVLGIAGRRRRFDELSLRRFSAWGALGGLLVSLLPIAAAGAGAASTEIAVIVGSLTVLSALSACGSLMLARGVENREALDPGPAAAGYVSRRR